MTYWLVIYEFLKTGLFSIGGGMATMPFLYAMADKYPWFSRSLLTDMIAISESTPGPIGINMATFAGYTAGGVAGGILASLALILPSVFIMIFVARSLDRFKENRFVQHAFYGLRPTVTALIAWAGLGLASIMLVREGDLAGIPGTLNWKTVLLYAVFVALLQWRKKLQPVWLICAAAVLGAAFKF